MPARHGTHHLLSYIAGIFLSVLIGELARKAMPGLFRIVDMGSILIVSTFGIHFNPELLSYFIIGTVVALLWGIRVGISEKKKLK